MPKLTLYPPLKEIFITQKFGKDNTDPGVKKLYKSLGLEGHNGIDYRAPDGTDIFACHAGTVMSTNTAGAAGLGVVIVTDEKYEYKKGEAFYKTIFWHMKTGSICVSAGQKVVAGQKIGEADNTGLSVGSHLHLGLKACAEGKTGWDWKTLDENNGYGGAIDPLPYFTDVFVPFKKEMKRGDFSDDVQTMQAFFLRIGLMSPINPNEFGWYGKKTAKAVYEFMKNSGKLSTYEQLFWRGENVGKKTLAELNLRYK